MAHGRSSTAKTVVLLVLSLLLVGGALAYRYWPTRARCEASYVSEHLVRGAYIDFEKPMTFDGDPRVRRIDLHATGEPARLTCNVASFSRAQVVSSPEDGAEMTSLKYAEVDSFDVDWHTCRDGAIIAIPTQTLKSMLLEQYRTKHHLK